MGIRCADYDDAERVDAATLPPFDNHSRCATCGNGREIRIHYAPSSRHVAGPHFKWLCPCGAWWNERAKRRLVG